MKRKLLLSLVVAVLGVTFSGLALAQDSIVKIQSQKGFDQTVSVVQSAASQNGLMVMGHLNQGKMLSMTGLQLKGESFLVGNPNMGKKLFTADHAVGLFVLVRIFVYEDSDGHTYVSYVKPSAALDQLNNPQVSMMAKMLDMKIQGIAQAATH
ncbi:MAG TPA: DUF302 domain-containing protein [Terriglobia bacterium]|jgi:uncharacterized protein (DUF302 family)|nr:DUF302 domain-containing protein [Terriglobia bacterium]